MNKFLRVVLAILIVSSVSLNAKKKNKVFITDGDDIVNIDFKDLPIIDLIKISSKILEKNILLSQNISGKVDFVKTKPVRKKELVDILISVLDNKGFTLVGDENTLKIVTSTEASKSRIPIIFGKNKLKNLQQFVTEFIDIKKENVDVISSKIKHITSRYGKVITNRNTNTLIITDYPKNIKLVKKAIKLLERGLNKKLITIPIKNVALNSSVTVFLFVNTKELDVLERTIVNFLKKTIYKFDLIIVDIDNKLKSKKQKVLSDISKKVSVVDNPKQLSKQEIVNYYAKKIKSDYFLIANDAVKVMAGDWLNRLNSVMGKHDNCIAVGPTLFDNDFLIYSSSIKIDQKNEKALHYTENKSIGGTGVVPAVSPYGALINKGLYNQLGGLKKAENVVDSFVQLCRESQKSGLDVRFETDSEVVLYSIKK